ncbi:MAG: glutamine--tRNA ligase, partial [Gammaproteobacteria bacterium]
PRKFFRLGPGREVRLRYAYFITCNKIIKDEHGDVVELRCIYDPETKGGNAPDGRKVRGTIHWVSAKHALDAEVRIYDRLFNDPEPDSNQHDKDWKEFLNPESIEIIDNARLEPSLSKAKAGDQFQFERLGYFNVESKNSKADKPVFNRTIPLRDPWSKKR